MHASKSRKNPWRSTKAQLTNRKYFYIPRHFQAPNNLLSNSPATSNTAKTIQREATPISHFPSHLNTSNLHQPKALPPKPSNDLENRNRKYPRPQPPQPLQPPQLSQPIEIPNKPCHVIRQTGEEYDMIDMTTSHLMRCCSAAQNRSCPI